MFNRKLVKKTAVALLLILAVSAIGFAAAVWIKYRGVSRADIPVVEIAPSWIKGGDSTSLGKKFEFTALFKVPWGVEPKAVSAQMPDGLQLAAEPRFERESFGWGYTLVKAVIPLQSYRAGEIKEGRASVVFGTRKPYELVMPPLLVKPLEVSGNEPSLAGELEVRKTPPPVFQYVIIALLALTLIVTLIYSLRRRGRELADAATPWEVAVGAIHSLLAKVNAGKTGLESSVAELTDIVRGYLERRFELRAGRQTTSEFLSDIELRKDLLNERQSGFLREFLVSADMVKFAKAPADRNVFEDAARKAEALVNQTIPMEKKAK